jgi:hypothetical protein
MILKARFIQRRGGYVFNSSSCKGICTGQFEDAALSMV